MKKKGGNKFNENKNLLERNEKIKRLTRERYRIAKTNTMLLGLAVLTSTVTWLIATHLAFKSGGVQFIGLVVLIALFCTLDVITIYFLKQNYERKKSFKRCMDWMDEL
ncbi:MAG: hypothetical protein R3Y24_13860 [Eubacteriales bacterium]